MTYKEKRFCIATSALNGLMANPSWDEYAMDVAVERAIVAADLLLASLVDGPREIEGTITEAGEYPEGLNFPRGCFVTVRIPPGKFSDDILGRTVKISFEREEK
jgi:hypothetical protein